MKSLFPYRIQLIAMPYETIAENAYKNRTVHLRGIYLLQSRWIWRHLPNSLKNLSVGRAYGRHLHSFICRYSTRSQSYGTFFMRNRPEMELMCRLIDRKALGAKVAIAVLACSKGAEVYS